MGLYPSIIGDIMLVEGINTLASGVGQVVEATIIAHPSNVGILYVRQSNTTGYGYPLTAGATVTINLPNLNEYTVSGVSGHRVAYIAHK